MKLLIVGSGGREHALAWKMSQSALVDELYCAPGNAGMAELAHCIDIQATQLDELAGFAADHRIDLTLVGPELPLALGLVDKFQGRGLRILGPTREAARLEASKLFTKQLLKDHQIPTADFNVFTSPTQALDYIKGRGLPQVIKADGLAAGKGVMVAGSFEEARMAITATLVERRFGPASSPIIIEEFLTGEEVSYIALVDGKTIRPLASSQDHKALYDGDKGLNTGGMGAYSPAPIITERLDQRIMGEIIEPTVSALKGMGITYRGVIYAGLMIVDDAPYLLEFNVRFGDPETQPIVMRLDGDLAPILLAATSGRLKEERIEWQR